MTTLGDAVIEVIERGEEDEESGAKNGGGWSVNRLRGRAREHLKRPLSTGKKEKWGLL